MNGEDIVDVVVRLSDVVCQIESSGTWGARLNVLQGHKDADSSCRRLPDVSLCRRRSSGSRPTRRVTSLMALCFFLFSHSWYFSSQIWNFDKITQNVWGFHMELREIQPSPKASRLPLHQYSILKNIRITQSDCPTVPTSYFPSYGHWFWIFANTICGLTKSTFCVHSTVVHLYRKRSLQEDATLRTILPCKNLVRRFDFMAKSLCK